MCIERKPTNERTSKQTNREKEEGNDGDEKKTQYILLNQKKNALSFSIGAKKDGIGI